MTQRRHENDAGKKEEEEWSCGVGDEVVRTTSATERKGALDWLNETSSKDTRTAMSWKTNGQLRIKAKEDDAENMGGPSLHEKALVVGEIAATRVMRDRLRLGISNKEEAIRMLWLMLQDSVLTNDKRVGRTTISKIMEYACQNERIMVLLPSTMGEHVDLADGMIG